VQGSRVIDICSQMTYINDDETVNVKTTNDYLKGVYDMPRGDGTGPAGMGPMTGRAAGYCAGYPVPGYANRPAGFRAGMGYGRGGRGRRNWYYATGLTGWQRSAGGYPAWGGMVPGAAPATPPPAAPASKEDQLDALRGQAEYLSNALDDIRRQIAELENNTDQE